MNSRLPRMTQCCSMRHHEACHRLPPLRRVSRNRHRLRTGDANRVEPGLAPGVYCRPLRDRAQRVSHCGSLPRSLRAVGDGDRGADSFEPTTRSRSAQVARGQCVTHGSGPAVPGDSVVHREKVTDWPSGHESVTRAGDGSDGTFQDHAVARRSELRITRHFRHRTRWLPKLSDGVTEFPTYRPRRSLVTLGDGTFQDHASRTRTAAIQEVRSHPSPLDLRGVAR